MTVYNMTSYNMNNSASDSEPQTVVETGKRAFKANKACMPCRAQKLKCDAALTGLPCSRCTSKQCVTDCILPVRKRRTTKKHTLPVPSNTTYTDLPATSTSSQSDSLNQPHQPSIPNPPGCRGSDLLYLSILNDAVPENTESSRRCTSASSHRPKREDSFTPRNYRWAKLHHLDDTDYSYLVQKGVFELPPPRHLDALVKTYFDHVFPFVSVINRADFIRGYQSGNCSLFLLHAILTPASLHAPADVLSACGFTTRSAAQESFFSKARLLHDLAAEDDPLVILQGSIILCMVILDHPTDRDFSYWLHNAVRLATKLDLRNTCVREDKSCKVLKLYRRIWWALYSLDVFHVFVNTKRSRLLEDTPAIKLRTEDDWEVEDVSGASSDLLSALTPQQKALPVIYCELSRIFGECLSVVTNKSQQDPHRMLHPLDAWRKSLPNKMHVDENNKNDIYYLNVQAMSYRFECILCRLVRRQQFRHADWSDWAKQRLRTAILELDMIAMRVLASGTLQDFPIAFVTTITALLALNIELALNPSETDLVRSMARISISQATLVLAQGKEIPVLRRALPIFEEILAKTNLYLVSPSNLGQASAQSQSQDNTADTYASPPTHANVVLSHQEQYENNAWFDLDSLGFDFLDESQIGQLGFTS
ncbi:fungal-specific transcription factor domain-containing protein [Xylaria scruposa]|nr:fungal-specific transcription factor domain-containing protein [Xylaria scruposa]